jgi:predicted component of type VI protein secretion system
MRTPTELQSLIAAQREGKPFLAHRTGSGAEGILPLPERGALAVGRAAHNDLALEQDASVSRVHATLECAGGAWLVADDGLSRNGTWVNGERLSGRRRLTDGDVITLGTTTIAFHDPAEEDGETLPGTDTPAAPALTARQREVLVALARPCRDASMAVPPATNQEIADELVLSLDGVKTHVRSLFERFGVGDLPQNRKRHALVAEAFRTGAIGPGDL